MLVEYLSLQQQSTESEPEEPFATSVRTQVQSTTLSDSSQELLVLAVRNGILAGAEPAFDELVGQSRFDRAELLDALAQLGWCELLIREGFIDEDPKVVIGYRLRPFTAPALGERSEAVLKLLAELSQGLTPVIPDEETLRELLRNRLIQRNPLRLNIEPVVAEIIDAPTRLATAHRRAVRQRLGIRDRLSALAAS